jgi:hypothetical protein
MVLFDLLKAILVEVAKSRQGDLYCQGIGENVFVQLGNSTLMEQHSLAL